MSRRTWPQLDLASFDPKAPPPKTAAFWDIVNTGGARGRRDGRLIELLGNPQALVLADVIGQPTLDEMFGLAEELNDRKARRALPHKFERVNYLAVRNPDAEDGLFKIRGRRQVVYAQRALSLPEQVKAARRLGQVN